LVSLKVIHHQYKIVRKIIGHFFSKFDFDLDLTSFIKSKLEISIEKISLDTYLKIFDANLTDIDPSIKPENQDKLVSNLIVELDSDEFFNGYGNDIIRNFKWYRK
jgi:hypothetical protein